MKTAACVATFVAMTLSPAFGQDTALPSATDWTGGHVGVHAGFGSGHLTYGYYTAPPNFIPFDVDGYVAGVQGGYDWQFGQMVVGVSGEFSGATIGGTVSGAQYPCGLFDCSANADWLGTVDIRAGLALDRVLPFITAGLAAGGIRGEIVDISACFPATPCSFGETRIGTTFGLGVEVAVDEHLSVTGKFQRVDLGPVEFPGGAVRSDNFIFNTMTIGANWGF